MRSPKDFDWKKHLESCLASTEFCTISTVDRNGVWSNPVYFVWDDQYRLYFVSQENTRHMKNIAKDPRVSVAIYSTKQSTFENVRGIQLEGKAEFVVGEDRMIGVRAYAKRLYPALALDRAKEKSPYIDSAEWKYVRITPAHLYYFDTEFFGEERQEVQRKLIS